MELFFLVAGLLSLLGGAALGILSRKERPKSEPWVYLNPKMWLPWKPLEGLTKKGVKLHLSSIALMVIGCVFYFVSQGIPFDLN